MDKECCGNQAAGVAVDKWKHRAANMRCVTCMWFMVKDVVPDGNPHTQYHGDLGRCRRHAPTINGFPAVFTIDWCGDHKLDENKL